MYKQIVGVPIGTNCAALRVDLFLYCYGTYFILTPSDNDLTDVNESFNNTLKSSLLNIDNPF